MWFLHQPFSHPAPWAQQVPGAAPWTYQTREQASGEAEGGCVGGPRVLRREGPTGQGDLGVLLPITTVTWWWLAVGWALGRQWARGGLALEGLDTCPVDGRLGHWPGLPQAHTALASPRPGLR